MDLIWLLFPCCTFAVNGGTMSANENEGADSFPWYWSGSNKSKAPLLIGDLVGREVRFVKVGDAVTKDLRPGRVTIWHTPEYRIESIVVEPGDPILS
ncbi:hypothetical protein [Delftia acidovorans]|uniref:hypothetical protein n=1 Tax=Delftia acidovorans TaxID=80866 RepID=UPI001144CF43|nr:hypothetical protein [Delftia acidovorans]